MKLSEAKETFIHNWGNLCTNWGVTKAMGQIHALLLISPQGLCSDQIMTQLSISRGNVHMNLKALEDWRLIQRDYRPGERKSFYVAEKDLSKILKIVIEERKKRELDPLLGLLKDIGEIRPNCPESSEFCRMTKEIERFASKADHALLAISSSQAEWISKILLR